jgi:lactoylglutathione lyase
MFTQMDYTMVIVSDMAKSVQFYRDTLGIPLKFESPEWTEFATGTTTLALHGGGVAREYHDTGDQSKTAGSCSIGFNVEDVDKTYEDLKAKGVRFVMPPTRRDDQGIKLAVAIDPDGLPISFAQMIG